MRRRVNNIVFHCAFPRTKTFLFFQELRKIPGLFCIKNLFYIIIIISYIAKINIQHLAGENCSVLTYFYKFEVSSSVYIEINVPEKEKKKNEIDDVESIVEDVWNGDMDDGDEEETIEVQFED